MSFQDNSLQGGVHGVRAETAINPLFAPLRPKLKGVAAQSLVATDQGQIAAREVRPGMLVQDADGAMREVLGTIHRISQPDDFAEGPAAVSMPAMAVLPGVSQPVTVAIDQEVILDAPCLQQRFGHARCRVRAGDLLEYCGFEPAASLTLTFVEFVFEACELVDVAGLAVTSFVPCANAMSALDAVQRRDLVTADPRLGYASGWARYADPTPLLNAKELARIAPDLGLDEKRSDPGENVIVLMPSQMVG